MGASVVGSGGEMKVLRALKVVMTTKAIGQVVKLIAPQKPDLIPI